MKGQIQKSKYCCKVQVVVSCCKVQVFFKFEKFLIGQKFLKINFFFGKLLSSFEGQNFLSSLLKIC